MKDCADSISFLNYKITGSNIGIEVEKTRQEIEASKDEIEKLANTLIKVSYVIADGSSRFGGMPEEHQSKIKEYQNSIKDFLDKNIDDEISNTISGLNDAIDLRIKSAQNKT